LHLPHATISNAIVLTTRRRQHRLCRIAGHAFDRRIP
jgi:hypothetical protein